MSDKPRKYIDQVKNPVVRPCPGAKNHFCCNLVIVSQILNCPYNCSYCFLHTFFGREEIVIYRDNEKIIQEVLAYMQSAKGPLRFCTGEYSDSLAMPEAESLAVQLVNVFSRQRKHLLELKTKSINIDRLLSLDHNHQTIISWSVNPPVIIKQEEHDAPDLDKRLLAAQRAVAAGYLVGFHFDPIIYFPGWEKAYESVVREIGETIPTGKIAWISLGCLRFPAAQKELMLNKFKSRVDFSAFLPGEDNKLRYPKVMRIMLFSQLIAFLKKYLPGAYCYLCMEEAAVWQALDLGKENPPVFQFANREPVVKEGREVL
ncbi:hypothetical protein A2311_06305 [candidate division WOR-1 bacterium RIFOXYB2_FULL_48_7]|uniref:DNA photolyase n=1 Tax=candidate division WOR-1 bacterium RIFOXYB2_FULL_48_7 TaxID=1802583 RepID=A0A1F4TXH0_UNCSA|nr:MAG: hypothetical protein A2311_06305 [candidate division WOR-1 bacterium RIFOXYB2_FULL_48_7]